METSMVILAKNMDFGIDVRSMGLGSSVYF